MKSPDAPANGTPAAPALSHNARVGLVLFLIYLALYGGFILLSAFARNFMGSPGYGGVNIAIVYGLILILGAFVLAMIYMALCKSEPAPIPDLTEGELAEEAQKEEGGA